MGKKWKALVYFPGKENEDLFRFGHEIITLADGRSVARWSMDIGFPRIFRW